MYLTYDIGGTNIRGAITAETQGKFQVITQMTWTHQELLDGRSSASHPVETIDILVDQFERRTRGSAKDIKFATLAVAGKTDYKKRKAKILHHNYTEIKAEDVEATLRRFGSPANAYIINDFEAVAYGASFLNHSRCELLRGAAIPKDQQEFLKKLLVCGPGTGLGTACLILDAFGQDKHFVLTSEAQHQTFAPELPELAEFASSMSWGRLSYEEVVSAPGLSNIYHWLNRKDNPHIHGAIAGSPEVCERASNGDFCAMRAIELFSYTLGQYCANQVLAFNCDRGVYLWGGVLEGLATSQILRSFSRAYDSRLKYSENVSAVPVYRIQDVDLAHRGCIMFSRIQAH